MAEIICEMGINHRGSLNLARRMILEAKNCGCNIIKTQLYDPAKLFPSKEIWAQERNWYPEVKKTQLTKKQVFELADFCQQNELEFLASVFDWERLYWLEELKVPRHKIASRALLDWHLVNLVAMTGKPLLVSLGLWNRPNFPIIRTTGKVDFLYCVSEYPTPPEHLNLPENFTQSGYTGFSDHCAGIEASKEAIRRGALIVEKHFCLDRSVEGPDILCSITPDELRELVQFAAK